MKNTILISVLLLSSFSFGQSIGELYNKKDFEALVKYEKDAGQLSGEELYMVGFAFFQLENDDKAISFYDRAIAKGYNSGHVHYDKALSLRYAKRLDDSIREFDIAISKEPENQMFMSEKAYAYYYSKQYDKALEIFEKAKKLPNTFQAPYYMIPHIHLVKNDTDKALKGFYEALNHISKDNKYYGKTLADIGNVQYLDKKDYTKAAEAYSEAIALSPKNYELYPKLIKAYTAGKQYEKADAVFNIMKTAYNNNELPEDYLEFKTVAINEYKWNDQMITVHKFLVDPKDMLDISYKVYLLNKAGNKVERTFMVEKTLEMSGGPKHLLCEREKATGKHITYPYGWNTDIIQLEDLKKAVGLVLDNKINEAASSNFGKN